MQKALHVVDVLHTQRLIQAVLFGQSLLSSGTDGLFCHERATGDQVHDKKVTVATMKILKIPIATRLMMYFAIV